ncbi:MAG: hypothetical protein ABSE18_02135 [Minisyncoccia bacterium]|jgi:hypothetical protein
MSKLLEIRKVLFNNPKVETVDIQINTEIPTKMACCTERVDSESIRIFVAPKVGIRDADKLQEFMMQLVPNMAAARSDPFRELEHKLLVGVLWFEEEIGREHVRREITLTDESLLTKLPAGFDDATRVIETESALFRIIFVRVYPNVAVALLASQGQFPDYPPSVPKGALDGQKRMPRILHRLGFTIGKQ